MRVISSVFRKVAAAILLCATIGIAPAWAACRSAETEPNNADSTANADVCSGTSISGAISSANDFDWYKLVVTGPGTINIILSHASNVDFDWFLYAATGSYIAYASTSSNPESGSKAVTAAGNYFVRVKRYSGTGNYTINVTGPLAGSSGLPAPIFGTFTLPPKNVGDAAFTITPPSSNSSGAFSYTSSNTSVATISGATLNVVGAGSSTITATQAADASHSSGSTTATFTVGGGVVWPCTLPTGVNLGKVGSTTDSVATSSGGTVLMGGGTDVDAAIQWMIGKSGGGDVVVLRSTGTNAYNSYIFGLGAVNSVQTLLINTTAEGDNACVGETIRRAEMVFIAGGNQQDYVNYFKGKAVGAALNYLINTKHAPIGGTSAGMAIEGQYYHPGGAPDDTTVLQNPTAVAIGNNFLSENLLGNVVTDTHFSQRNRQARLMSFMASTIYNFGVSWQSVRGVACDEATAYALDSNGSGKVFGTNYCFFAKATGAPEILSPAAALTWNLNHEALNVYRVQGTAAGTNTFNTDTFTGTGGTTQFWSSDRGTLTIR